MSENDYKILGRVNDNLVILTNRVTGFISKIEERCIHYDGDIKELHEKSANSQNEIRKIWNRLYIYMGAIATIVFLIDKFVFGR